MKSGLREFDTDVSVGYANHGVLYGVNHITSIGLLSVVTVCESYKSVYPHNRVFICCK